MTILKGFILAVLFIHGGSSASENSKVTLKSSDKKEWVLVDQGDFKVSENCLKTSCFALKSVKPKKLKESNAKFLEHPAASFCESQKGRYITAQYNNGDEDGLCVFKDGSYILGWDYYQKNVKEKK